MRPFLFALSLTLSLGAHAAIFTSPPCAFKPSVEVIGIFVEDCQGRLLLLHRQERVKQGNRWGIPGGKLEPHESPLEAGRRELLEETGIDLLVGDLTYIGKFFICASDCDFVYHMAKSSYSGPPTAIFLREREHKGFTWLLPNEALELNLMEDEAPCIEAIYPIKRI